MKSLLAEFARENNVPVDDLKKVIEWVSNPTRHPIVPVREFLESPYYMGTKKADGTSLLYPAILDELDRINSGDYDEAVLTGGIGSGKTTCALYTTAYQLYVLSCYENPHELFSLDPSSEIVFIFQSVSAQTAKAVDYQRFRAMIERSPYFREHFPFNKDFESELIFPHRIIVRPVSSKDSAAIGQNVFGGVIDEINFMEVIENSRQSIDGGTYNQAIALYNSISKRRKSRFSSAGSMPGVLCLVSSARYPGQFTDQKKEEAMNQIMNTGKSSIYIFDKRTWDIKPAKFFMDTRFFVYPGDATKQPRVLMDRELATEYERKFLIEVPMDYLNEFQRDIMGSLRDIAGISTVAKHPFFLDIGKISSCFGTTPNVLSKTKSTLEEHDTISMDISAIEDVLSPRFAHIDLAISGDSAGICIGHVSNFVSTKRGGGTVERLPSIVIDAILEVPPPKGGEILFYRIRDILYALRDTAKMPIKWVTLDSFQSKDTMQILKQRGFTTGYQSIDTTIDPYVFLKSAFYDGRVKVPTCDKLQMEIISLEKDVQRNKIDHPPTGSKDSADALAGVVYGLTMRREVWAYFGVLFNNSTLKSEANPALEISDSTDK